MANIKKADRRAPLETFYCVVCAAPIPEDRLLKKAVTCSKSHATVLKNERRRLRDAARCSLCKRPSNPEERALFAAWRKTLPQPKKGRPFKVKPANQLANGSNMTEDTGTSGFAP
jgi:predicted nucleic acid-binding Zn ribbon protein